MTINISKPVSSLNGSLVEYWDESDTSYNMEYDLRSTPWILDKVRNSNQYSQHLYAALCNNSFTKTDPWSILKEKVWFCSWRHAGAIIAHMKQNGSYMDWYCSGTMFLGDVLTYITKDEGVVTDEIRSDLLTLGWLVRNDEKR